MCAFQKELIHSSQHYFYINNKYLYVLQFDFGHNAMEVLNLSYSFHQFPQLSSICSLFTNQFLAYQFSFQIFIDNF